MALFLVLEDFAAGTSTAAAGSILDSTAVDLAPLQAAGLAIVAYNPATMAAPREAFLAARGSRPSVPDTAGDLSALLLAAGAIGGSGGGVTSVSASAPLASSGGATPTISLTAGAAPGEVLTWNGAAWAPAAGGGYAISPAVAVPSGGSHTCTAGNEFVRVAPTGTGAITVTLPNPATTTGQTITVKKVTSDAIDVVNVVPTAGLIDGAASYPLPASAYSVLSFTSDGTDYWVV